MGQGGLLAHLANSATISMLRAPSPLLHRASATMTTRDGDLRIRPGRIQHGNKGAKPPKSFVGEVMRAAKKAGHTGKNFRGAGGGKGRSTFGRGRPAALSLSSRSPGRRLVIMTRIVR